MADNVYEIIVERKLRNRFLVSARSSAEAAAAVGANISGTGPFAGSEETEVDRRLLNPRVVKGASSQTVLDFQAEARVRAGVPDVAPPPVDA